ncbi:universal stress protein [Candidatus Nitrosotenuis chungbukensis]|uniref:universal stress protein n=1 Tax=Candidatus Nitrosotenuis chungbukensis TaxID=1353246 RepID=UPI0005B2AA2B|nr:universal stress protein [Candidatus Nitrosotenuis chungbukensis]
MGKKYEQILVPYDGSKYYKKSLEEAIEIAKKFGSNIHLLHVIDALTAVPPVYDSPDTVIDMKKLERVLKNAVSKSDLILRNEILLCKENGVDADYKIITGSAADVILRFAKKMEIDLIVMGSQGLSGIRKILTLGSVSRKVSELAQCPVLLVR